MIWPEEWLSNASPGHCGETTSARGDCSSGFIGNLGLTSAEASNWTTAASACLDKCASCARCRYISVSLQWRDCSWYAACPMQKQEPQCFLSGMSSVSVNETRPLATIKKPSAAIKWPSAFASCAGALTMRAVVWMQVLSQPACTPQELLVREGSSGERQLAEACPMSGRSSLQLRWSLIISLQYASELNRIQVLPCIPVSRPRIARK